MRRRDGSSVTAEEVLSEDELLAYRRQHPQHFTGFEHLLLGADPAVVDWEMAVEEHIERGEN